MRGKIPSLITASSGKPTICTCKRLSKCKRCKEKIMLGERCADIPIAGKGYKASKRYCLKCFKEILFQSKIDIEQLEGLAEGVVL